MYLDHDQLQPDTAIAKDFDVVCAARLQPNKGIDRLIRAMACLPVATLLIIGDGPVSGPIDFIVNTGKYPAPTIDHTPSPTNDAKPILTGTVSSALVDRGFYLEVTENGNAICIVSPIKSTNWACPLAQKLADGPHVLSTDVDEPDSDEATPSGNPNAFANRSAPSPAMAPL